MVYCIHYYPHEIQMPGIKLPQNGRQLNSCYSFRQAVIFLRCAGLSKVFIKSHEKEQQVTILPLQ